MPHVSASATIGVQRHFTNLAERSADKGDKGGAFQALQFLTRPLDRVVKTVAAAPISVTSDVINLHRDRKAIKDADNKGTATAKVVVKAIFSPVTMPVKAIGYTSFEGGKFLVCSWSKDVAATGMAIRQGRGKDGGRSYAEDYYSCLKMKKVGEVNKALYDEDLQMEIEKEKVRRTVHVKEARALKRGKTKESRAFRKRIIESFKKDREDAIEALKSRRNTKTKKAPALHQFAVMTTAYVPQKYREDEEGEGSTRDVEAWEKAASENVSELGYLKYSMI